MTTRILIPLDGSRLAEQALSYGMTLGQGLPAELVLFRAVSIPSDVQEALDKAGLKPDPLMENLETDAIAYLEAMMYLLPKTGLSFSHVVRHGLAAAAIVDFVEQTNIQLIVMASHGHTGIKRWTHGSVAERVMQKASVPVLLVRAREMDSSDLQPWPCHRILVPLDGSAVAEQVLPAVVPIVQALNAELVLFRVPVIYGRNAAMGGWYPPLESTLETAEQHVQAYLDRVASRLENQGIETSTAVWTAPVAESIVQFAEINHVDLIAMCTHGRTGIARWALGSVADRVLRAGRIPILLVRAR